MVSWPDERSLSEGELDADPHVQFATWLREAGDAGEPMPNAMAVATASADGTPSVRMLLLEAADAEGGFVFQTNLDSPKARDLAAVPRTALAFFWPRLVRQVRVTGPVEPLTRHEAEAYFAAEPPPIQTMLRACRQSEVIADRGELERAYAAALQSAESGAPAHWGGYRVRVETIEFWQGRQNWLQDRLRYTRSPGGWTRERLVP
jgi:pyridoxamine 5'-phosphate oxidase